MTTKLPILFLSFFLLQRNGVVESANILFYSALGSQSTRISQWPLVEALVEKGHNVTFLSPLPMFDKDPTKTSKVNFYQPKKMQESVGDWDDVFNFFEMRKLNQGKITDLSLWSDFFEHSINTCNVLYSDPEYVDFLKQNQFDVVVLDTISNDCAYGAIHLWKAKSVLYLTTTLMPLLHDYLGIADETSTLHDMFLNVKDVNQMTFFERTVNALLPIGISLWREYAYLPHVEELTRKSLGEELTKTMPSFKEIDRSIDLTLLTSHYSFDYARSLPPNVIPIGGNVVAKEPKPLPKEMKEFLDSSPNGFIYISFGTVADFTKFDESVQINFIKALERFPKMRFIWKSHKPITAAPLPDNIFVAKWVPQQTILAHDKVKAYITHSGMGSTVEAIQFSVPLVCVPVLVDQDYLADMTVKRGAGIKVEILGLQTHELENAVREVLENKKYRDAMTRLTAVFKDRPSPPLETAVWHMEYLLRHDNLNEFLIPPSAKQAWWKRRQIDVWVVLSLAVSLITFVPLMLLYCIVKKIVCQGSSSSNNLKSKLKTK